MSLRIRFAAIVISIVAVFIVNIIALKFYLYWTYPGLDKVMHVAGGILAGNMVLIGRHATMIKLHKEMPDGGYLFVAVLGGLLIGILWEISEYMLGISRIGTGFVLDTTTDLVMDVFGALLAYISWVKIPHKTT